MSFLFIFPLLIIIGFFGYKYFVAQNAGGNIQTAEVPAELSFGTNDDSLIQNQVIENQVVENQFAENSVISNPPLKTTQNEEEVLENEVNVVAERVTDEELNMHGLTEDETWVLKHFVCFPEEYHNLKNIREVLSIGDADANWANNLVKSLTKKGWLIEPPHAEVFRINPDFLERIMREDPPLAEDIEMYAETVTGNLHIEKSIYENVDDYPWVPFGKAILKRFESTEDECIALLQNEMGRVLNEMGDFEGAKKSYTSALKFYEKEYGNEHENTAVLYLNSANVCKQLGDNNAAMQLLNKALPYYEKNLGELHPDTAMVYSWLGLILQENDDLLNDAQTIYTKLLNSDKHNFGESHENTANAYANLARVNYSCGDFKLALENASNSLQILNQLFPEGHSEIEAMKNGVKLIKEKLESVGVPG